MRHPLILTFLTMGLASCAQSQPKPAPLPNPQHLHTLIVSGGPTPDYTQYAIESNARFLEKLTANATARRILFADGRKASKTISAVQKGPDQDEQDVFAWLFDLNAPEEKTVYKASTLGKIDGPATKKSVLQNVAWLTGQAKGGEKSLLYFTGHGSPGMRRTLALLRPRWSEDYQNTNYSLWNEEELSVKDLAAALKGWPAKTPLVLIMVQCHAGGFANLLFQDGDPKKPLVNRDMVGFFAAIGERQASGCTSEVDETDYQDFTTHFFAALSGVSRDGRVVSGADYDGNGAVSMLEALAYTELTDQSIDVPVCTSEAYLRVLYPQTDGQGWMKTPYSTVLKTASPWQKAILEGLSKQLHLSGEARMPMALRIMEKAMSGDADDAPFPASLDQNDVRERYERLEADLKRRFPALKAPSTSVRFKNAKPAALRYLRTHKQDVKTLAMAVHQWNRDSGSASTREALAMRFIRANRTLVLEARLRKEGTPAQKAAFAKLRTAEGKNPLR